MKNIHKSQIAFVIAGLIGLNAAVGIAAQKSDSTQPTRANANTSPAAAIAYLNYKNKDGVATKEAYFAKNPAARVIKLAGQSPYVAILSCADSRVPMESVIESDSGSLVSDIFSVRVAGNVVGDDAIASLEYAVKYLNTPLLLVLGHEQCGAVSATMGDYGVGGALPQLLGKIRPAIQTGTKNCKDCTKEQLFEKCIEENVRLGMNELMKRSEKIRTLVGEGKIAIGCGVINLENNKIKWVDAPAVK
ncbi:MAG: carbonic anhydrase [Phycisphaerales bacterium]|nr:carbonic anhydrase [Phycisphaerales bacterium]